MADTKITALTALTGADPANDVIPIVDVSDTTMAASGTTKKISVNNILGASGTATLASATITGDLTVNSNVNVGASPAFYGGKIATNGSIAIAGGNYLKLWNSTGTGVAGINAGAADTLTFSLTNAFTTAMTLNSTGLGVGVVPSAGDGSGVFKAAGTGSGAANTRIGLDVREITSGNAAGIWLGAMNSENTGVIGSRTASGNIAFQTFNGASWGERMRIDYLGNVGIGVTPSAWGSNYKSIDLVGGGRVFTVSGTGTHGFSFNAFNNNTNWLYQFSTVASRFELQQSGNFAWFTAPSGTAGTAITFTQAMTLDSGGNLLVGKTANYGAGEIQTLQLKSSVIFASDNTGSASNRNWSIGTNVSGAGNMEWTISSTNTGFPNFAYRMQLTSAGAAYNSTGTWGTISDSRLKENISDARNYLADLLKLRVVKYSLKEEASAVATKLGLIAQEVEQVFPSLVEQSDVAYDGGDGIRTVKTSILVPMLLKAIQELTARVQTLETR